MSKERWRWVDGYEGLYMVSDRGRVMSVPKTAEKSNGVSVSYSGQVLEQAFDLKGYPHVALSRNGSLKTYAVHRLVAKAFVANPANHSCVNHIDENKSNNIATNLEWCSVEYNNRYGSRGERISRSTGKPVQMIQSGLVVKEFASTKDAERTIGVCSSHVSECCNGIRKTASGYVWRYKEEI